MQWWSTGTRAGNEADHSFAVGLSEMLPTKAVNGDSNDDNSKTLKIKCSNISTGEACLRIARARNRL